MVKRKVLLFLQVALAYAGIGYLIECSKMDDAWKGSTLTPLLFMGIAFFVLFVLNLIVPFLFGKSGTEARKLLFTALTAKVLLIPLYAFIFYCGIALAIVPGLFVLIPILTALDYLLLLATSMYGISGMVFAHRRGEISTACMGVNIALHLMFCLDVFSSVYIFFKVRRVEKKGMPQVQPPLTYKY